MAETPTRTITREQLLALHTQPASPSSDELAALERLLSIAQSDTGQSRRVADFLLAWWNADSCGGFDLTNLWAVDTAIARDIVAVFAMVARVHSWPSSDPFKAYTRQFENLVRQWRPQLFGDS